MIGLRKQIRGELSTLVTQCESFLVSDKQKIRLTSKFFEEYQNWYSRALAPMRYLLPDRLDEFVSLYKSKPAGKTASSSAVDYGIDSYLMGVRVQRTGQFGEPPTDVFDHEANVIMRVRQQNAILRSSLSRSEDILSNISGLLQVALFDSQLDAARELSKHGHLRAAGAVAGVVLEAHLASVAHNHNLSVKKKDPSVADWNDALKNADVIDVPIWRNIQRLGDIRNYCVHKKDRDPTKDEVAELLDGVDKVAKTLV